MKNERQWIWRAGGSSDPLTDVHWSERAPGEAAEVEGRSLKGRHLWQAGLRALYQRGSFLLLPQVPNLLQPVCAGVAGSEFRKAGGQVGLR